MEMSLSRLCFVVGLVNFAGLIYATDEGLPVIKEHPKSMVVRRNDPATLNCAASGAKRIRWFKDGELVQTADLDHRSHIMQLDSGSLFFLRVAASRKDHDAGTYWCVATNSFGYKRSKNATLTVSTIDEEFLEVPDKQVNAQTGQSLILPCKPPRGTPPPAVSWLKDGGDIHNDSRVHTTLDGNLAINEALEKDSGEYRCVARNLAGTRESSTSVLSVLTPPWFEDHPENITAAAGATVALQCRYRGVPLPNVTWRRLDGKIPPLERTHIMDDKRLQLTNVIAEDSGVYICEAENIAGVASLKAVLRVVAAPELIKKPQNKQVITEDQAQLFCSVAGDPKPLLLWRLPDTDRSAVLVAGHSSGHASVSEDGEVLMIDNARIVDSGIYQCWGISSGGSVSSKSDVIVVEALPPPLIGVGPRDQVVFPGDSVTMSCETTSEATAVNVTWWYRKASHLPAHQLVPETRIVLPLNGALILKDVSEQETGIYTCRASADSGTVEASALLKVTRKAEEGDQDNARIHKPHQMPAPPSKPRIVSVNETSVELRWLPNSRMKAGGTESYTVEYWHPGWQEWRIAEAHIPQERCTIKDLTPNTAYVFLVRAVNEHNEESFPSPWSNIVRTAVPLDPGVTQEDIRNARRKLTKPAVTMLSATPVSPDKVQLRWEMVAPGEGGVEGVLVYTVGMDGVVKAVTVLGAASSSHLVRGLQPNTKYIFFLVPFWRSVEGAPSNSKHLTTPEDVPYVAPSDVTVEVRSDGAALITWRNLEAIDARGHLQGYRVAILFNGSSTTQDVISPWYEARGLLDGRLYTVRVAGVTRAGVGPWSQPVLLDFGSPIHPDRQGDETNEEPSVLYAPPHPAWLLYLLVPLLLFIVLAAFVYVRRLKQKSAPSHSPQAPNMYSSPTALYPPHHHVNMYGEQKLWRPTDSDKDSSVSSTRLLRPEHLINEYAEPRIHRPDDTTEPYATTALLAPASPRHMRIQQHQWRPEHSGCDDGSVQVNWAAFLPPPPACPPPADADACSSSTTTDSQDPRMYSGASSHYDNNGGSEQYERPCDAASEHTYDLCTPPISPPGGIPRDPFLTFNSLQARGARTVRADFHPPRPVEPKSNTH